MRQHKDSESRIQKRQTCLAAFVETHPIFYKGTKNGRTSKIYPGAAHLQTQGIPDGKCLCRAFPPKDSLLYWRISLRHIPIFPSLKVQIKVKNTYSRRSPSEALPKSLRNPFGSKPVCLYMPRLKIFILSVVR